MSKNSTIHPFHFHSFIQTSSSIVDDEYGLDYDSGNEGEEQEQEKQSSKLTKKSKKRSDKAIKKIKNSDKNIKHKVNS